MYLILYSLVYLLSWIPRPLGLRLGDFIGGVLYKVLKRRREIALKTWSLPLEIRRVRRNERPSPERAFKIWVVIFLRPVI